MLGSGLVGSGLLLLRVGDGAGVAQSESEESEESEELGEEPSRLPSTSSRPMVSEP
ncbi:hypothetical protein AB4Y72_11825 [Arthrobacter sp. YAF34]|uniref:hypothetical protein n=1 Tax=Arthrobacter sp. YAF34 TaxID=3233083 RepID=UPI003F92EF7C